MRLTTEPIVQWVTASPLWESVSDSPAAMQRPALLRFTTDAFMDDLARTLASPAPEALATRVATPVSFRARPVGAAPGWTPPAPTLKLYQPFHGHFNMVACSLVCRVAGLPDRVVDSASGERAAFVIRRLAADGPNGATTERAWAEDTALGIRRWLPVPAGEPALAPGEELHPLFPLNFAEDGRARRLLAGLIPTESRESAPPDSAVSSLAPSAAELASEVDPRLADLDLRVIAPLDALRALHTGGVPSQTSEEDASRFLMLDLGEWLETHLPAFWNGIVNNLPKGSGASGLLYDALGAAIDPTLFGSPNWRDALRDTWAKRDIIAGDGEGEPNALSSVRRTTLVGAPPPGTTPTGTTLRERIAALLPPVTANPIPATQLPPTLRWTPKFDGNPATRYVLRCVYLRPLCEPLIDPVISPPSEQFAIAPVFDPDAPARTIRIPLPVDTSIKGLRQHSRGVGVLISNQLRQQMNAITDLKKTLDGDIAEGEPFDLGLLCSFSIPIITIVAILLLMMILILLNIVFWWLPFFKICLPLKFSAK